MLDSHQGNSRLTVLVKPKKPVAVGSCVSRCEKVFLMEPMLRLYFSVSIEVHLPDYPSHSVGMSILFASPNVHLSCCSENLIHDCYLSCSFFKLVLIDANSIDPMPMSQPACSQLDQSMVEVRVDIECAIIEVNFKLVRVRVCWLVFCGWSPRAL